MGIFERIGTWPEGIVVADSRILYLPGEIVVFARDTDASNGPIAVWTYYESNNTWARVNYIGTGPDRTLSSPGFATDPEGARAFFFGGSIGYNSYNDLYIYDHSIRTWTHPVVANPPSARSSVSMVYDGANDLIWIFGGSTGYGQRSNALFSYSFVSGWSQFNPTNRPSTRSGALMEVYGDNIYIALGSAGGGGYANDLWSYSMTSGLWTQIKATLGVRTHGGAAFVYDRVSDTLFMSMGFNYHSSGGGNGWNEYLNHTYWISPSNGTIERVYIDPRITPRYLQAWTIDGSDIIIFGGSQGEQDVWKLNITTLLAEGIPPSTYIAGGTQYNAFDPDDGGRLYIISYRSSSFGDGGSYSSWLITYYSLADGSWNYLDVITPPEFVSRSGMAGAYDPVANQFYLYGGYYSYTHGSYPNEETHYYFYESFWRIDIATGTMVELEKKSTWPGPIGRGCMVVDRSTPYGRVFLFGGQIAGGTSTSDAIAYYNITSNTWVKLNPPMKPYGRYDTPLVMDPSRKAFFMFGGRDNASNPYNDLWMFHTDSMKWEQMSGASDPPSARYGHGMSVNTDNGEVMVLGKVTGWGDQDEPATTYLYRPGWMQWLHNEDNTNPYGWSNHGQAYSPITKTVYIWNGPDDSSEVWRIKPILRTIAEQARIVDGSGVRITEVFPTYSDYTLKFSGYSDIGVSDIDSLWFELTNGTLRMNATWTPGSPLQLKGSTEWVAFPGTPAITSGTGGKWSLDIPIEFTFEGVDGTVISINYLPRTLTGYTEKRQTVNAFTLYTDLDVSKVTFSTDLQSIVEPGSWLFSGTNLDLSGFQLSFHVDSNIHPASTDFTVTYSNQEGVTDQWVYVPGEQGNLSVPIAGKEGKLSRYYLNVTNKLDERISSQVFTFKIDATAPLPPTKVAFRADSVEDQPTNVDNDKDVYLTWGKVYDNGSGVKGVCYSMDTNLWPSESNITLNWKQLRLSEGRHTLFIWSVDNTSRVGPYQEVPLIIDTHKPIFYDPLPMDTNVTVFYYTVSIKVRDELSGVVPGTIQYHQTGTDRLFKEWANVPVEYIENDNGNYTITMEVPLIPKIKNLVQFRAADVAGTGYAESMILTIYTDPELVIPKVTLISPDNGALITDPVELKWSTKFLDLPSVTYEVTVIDPYGNNITVGTGSSLIHSYSPSYPGMYTWKVFAIAPGKTGESAVRTFRYDPPFPTITPPATMTVKRNQSFELDFDISSSLKVQTNLTFNIANLQGFVLSGDTRFAVTPGSEGGAVLHLNASKSQLGDHTFNFNITDDYGRWSLVKVTVKVEDDWVPGTPDPDGDGKGSSLVLFIVIAAVVLLLVALIVFFIVRRRNKSVLNMKVQPTEEDEGSELDLSYDPMGVVGSGSIPSGTVGRSEYEDLQRGSASNVMELQVPTVAEEPAKKEKVAHEFEEIPCKCGNIIKITSKVRPLKFKCYRCGRHGVLEAEQDDEEVPAEDEEITEFEE
jgi:hypothetical protein